MYRSRSTIEDLVRSGSIGITPYLKKFQGPNLYYCHLGNSILVPKKGIVADTRNLNKELYDQQTIDTHYDLEPGEFLLAELFERLMTKNSHAIRLFNSSSLARLGVVQCAVGMVNPGCGVSGNHRITLELTNTGPFTIRLYPTLEHNGVIDWGTEVLKIGVVDHETIDIGYEEWSGALYSTDETVSGSKIDQRESHE